jgi:TonB family protein
VIEIRLKPGGAVKTAKIKTSSGNSAFDVSAVKAVYEASPLPVSYDVFSDLKHFDFKFSK